MKIKTFNYRCACCDLPQQTGGGHFRTWSENSSTVVKICADCNDGLKKNNEIYVYNLIQKDAKNEIKKEQNKQN